MSRASYVVGGQSGAGCALVLTVLSLGGPVRAQEPIAPEPQPAQAAVQLEDVVVTARRREERVQDVPLAVSAFSSEKIATLGITDQTRLSDFTPGFQFTDYTEGRVTRGAFRSLVFRGLSLSNNTGVTSAGLVFLDGAPVVAGDVLITDSLQRVEVLKGPQNVYFGRSTFSGAVNYVTRNPGNEFKGSLAAEGGSYDQYKLDGHVEGAAIRDMLTFSLDGQLYNRSGDWTNAAQPRQKLGSRGTKSVAVTLYATPVERLSIKIYANYYTFDDGAGAEGFIPSTQANCNPGGQPGGPFYQCRTVGSLNSKFISETLNFTKNEDYALEAPAGYRMLLGQHYCDHFGSCADTLATHLIANYAFSDGIRLAAIVAYHRRNVDDLANLVQVDASNQPNANFGSPTYPTAPPFNTFDYSISNRTTDLSVEARVSSPDTQRLRWTLGANYVDATDLSQILFYTNTGAAGPPGPGATFGSTGAKTYGVFGGVYLQPVGPLVLSLEGRAQSDGRTDISSTNGAVFSKTFTSFSPRASADYKIGRDLNAYVSYAAGVRPGGFNAVLSGLPPALLAQIQAQTGENSIAYKEERLSTTEIGLKGALFERRVGFDVSGYVGKLKDEQSSTIAFTSSVNAGGSGGEYTLINNRGSVDISGVEADADWKVSRVVTLSGTFAYNKTRIADSNCYTCFLITGSTSIDGKRLTGAPETTFTVAIDASDSLTSRIGWFAHADVAYKGNQFIDQVNLIGTGVATLVDLQAGLSAARATAEIFLTNALDDKTVLGGQTGLDFTTFSNYGLRVGLPERRTVGMRVKYRFGA